MLRGRMAGWETPGEEAHLGSGEEIRRCPQLLVLVLQPFIWDESWWSIGWRMCINALREAADLRFAQQDCAG